MKMLFVSLLVYGSAAFASEALTTNSFQDVFQKIEEKVERYGRDKVLVVFDIDNTLLTARNDLGSDQWFSWQEEVMKDPACAPVCVTKDFKKLLQIQELLMTMGQMTLTEPDLPVRIKALQNKRQPIILLTSRGPDWRHLTEKALFGNGLNFSSTSVKPDDSEVYYLPYDINNHERYSLTKDDVIAAGLKEARKVSYKNGVYMTEGQNKGIMLKVFLNKFRTSFHSIIFVDDHQKHVDRMQTILGHKYDLVTFRYGGVDEAVARLKRNKNRISSQWYALKKTLTEIGFSI